MAAYQRYLEQTAHRQLTPIADPEILATLPLVWACSEFIARACSSDPALLADLTDSGDLLRPYDRADDFARRLGDALATARDEAALSAGLRRWRRREMVRIAWRDVAGLANYHHTVAELSALARAALRGALERLETTLRRELGTPHSPDGQPQALVVLGMGKLGAKELNFSSDIDLIFAYPEDGETRGGPRTLTNSEFFIRLSQRLIRLLGSVTVEGFVFRVDMRLRPFGEAGPLAASFDALENYYQSHGREWERYALVKAQPVAGDLAAGQVLQRLLHPFVYRRYLDYGSLESLREMKALIAAEVRRKGLADNVKLGPGGIREIEFIAQSYQLTRGGQQRDLQEPRLLPVLQVLGAANLLPEFAVQELTTAYIFLRNTEHRLQELADQQTQTLPGDDKGRAQLALGMGYTDWEAFLRDLNRHRSRVHDHFQRVLAAPQAENEEGATAGLRELWLGVLDGDRQSSLLVELGMGEELLTLLARLRGAGAVRALSRQGRERLDRLMPLLLAAAGRGSQPLLTMERLVGVLEAIGRRTAYLALLVENPLALSQLVRLCAASPWIASQLARHPVLLDELIDPRSLYAPPRREALGDALRQTLMRLPEEDLEGHMEALRHFQQSNRLRVAAADVTGVLPLMVVSDHLTEIAEVVLEEVLELAWRHLVAKHGRPVDGQGRPCEKGFVILGYGKLGGIELGYGSDLDLVFLHNADASGATDGLRPVEGAVFYARLAQRIVHILTSHTNAGRLYETDLRLRPSGASGLLVSSQEAFAHYQRQEAWTWEHQALVRARPIAGDRTMGATFQTLRQELLCRVRDPQTLKREVGEMREKMRSQLGSRDPSCLDVKQDRGGIADIEFLVQYAVLRHAATYPELAQWTDNIRQLDTLGATGLMSQEDVAILQEAYRQMRQVAHRAALQEDSSCLAPALLAEHRREVTRLWQQWLG